MTRRSAVAVAAATFATTALAACGRDGSRSPAATPAVAPTRPGGTLGLGIVGLFVEDLDRSLGFYRRLGLDIPQQVDTASGSFRLTQPNGQVLFWETFAYTRRDFPDYRPARGDRKVALEFGFAAAADVDAMYASLLAAGAEAYFEPTTWGDIRYAVVVDPDDNQIALRHPLAS